jgi:hypothetical protein
MQHTQQTTYSSLTQQLYHGLQPPYITAVWLERQEHWFLHKPLANSSIL